MAGKLLIPEPIHQYMTSVSLREPPILRLLREDTAVHQERAIMQVPPEQGQFMGLLVQLMGAKRTLEIGVFTGYSALAVALALPPDGSILACDINEDYAAIARHYWKAAGVDHMIDLRLRPALDTLGELLAEGRRNHFDFAFIDADKVNYQAYYECALELLRPGGLIAVDNVLWSGRVADPGESEPDTVALRAFNEKLVADSRVSLSMLPVADGLTLALKR